MTIGPTEAPYSHPMIGNEGALVLAPGINCWVFGHGSTGAKLIDEGNTTAPGLGAMVAKDVEDGTILSGNPARPMQGQ